MNSEYLSLLDVTSTFIWLATLLSIAIIKRKSNTDIHYYRYYLPNLYFKILFSFLFSFFYIIAYNAGGDTGAYFKGATALNNLLLESPKLYFEELISGSSEFNYSRIYNSTTGFPPTWIYFEESSFFISKIISLVSIFTLKSYFATSIIFAFLFSQASWKIYTIAIKSKLFNTKYLHLPILFIPSVLFWCSGVSKDTIMLISLFYTLYFLYQIATQKKLFRLRYWAGLILTCWIIFKIRDFMLIVILVPLLIAFLVKFIQTFNAQPIIKFTIKFVFGIALTIGVAGYFSTMGENLIETNQLVKKAVIIQQDFETNKAYGVNKYSLGAIELTTFGIIKTLPAAIFSGVFEPLPWKALKPSLVANGIESAILLFLIVRLFMKKQFFSTLHIISKNELLIFCMGVWILLALIAGFTSINYGVLVRIRAPLLPLLGVLFLISPLESENQGAQNSTSM